MALLKPYTFYTVHYGKLLQKRPTNAPVLYLFFCHLFAPTCFGRHSTIIRVLDIKEYSKLQRVSVQDTFFENVIQF
jgi:hypothetical protein